MRICRPHVLHLAGGGSVACPCKRATGTSALPRPEKQPRAYGDVDNHAWLVLPAATPTCML